MKVFSGTSNQTLAIEICKILNIPLGKMQVSRFQSGEIYCNIDDSVRGEEVFIVQSLAHPINELMMETFVIIDAMKRSSAGTINVVLPYYGYARQEKRDQPREPITAKLVADLLTAAGAQRVITMDLHAPAIQGFFNIPVDHMTAFDLIVEHLKKKDLSNAVVVSPDAGRVKVAEHLASVLDLPVALMNKRRPKHNEAAITHIIGDVKGKVPIVIEDMIDTGGTIVKVVETLVNNDALPEVILCATHGIFSGSAVEKLQNPKISEVVVTDTFPLHEIEMKNLTVLSTAPLFAEIIARVANKESISDVFRH